MTRNSSQLDLVLHKTRIRNARLITWRRKEYLLQGCFSSTSWKTRHFKYSLGYETHLEDILTLEITKRYNLLHTCHSNTICHVKLSRNVNLLMYHKWNAQYWSAANCLRGSVHNRRNRPGCQSTNVIQKVYLVPLKIVNRWLTVS